MQAKCTTRFRFLNGGCIGESGGRSKGADSHGEDRSIDHTRIRVSRLSKALISTSKWSWSITTASVRDKLRARARQATDGGCSAWNRHAALSLELLQDLTDIQNLLQSTSLVVLWRLSIARPTEEVPWVFGDCRLVTDPLVQHVACSKRHCQRVLLAWLLLSCGGISCGPSV